VVFQKMIPLDLVFPGGGALFFLNPPIQLLSGGILHVSSGEAEECV
jgi:hypothetical protein